MMFNHAYVLIRLSIAILLEKCVLTTLFEIVVAYLRNPLPEHREHVGDVCVPALQLPAAGLARGIEEGVLQSVALGADGRVHRRVRERMRPRRCRHNRPNLLKEMDEGISVCLSIQRWAKRWALGCVNSCHAT